MRVKIDQSGIHIHVPVNPHPVGWDTFCSVKDMRRSIFAHFNWWLDAFWMEGTSVLATISYPKPSESWSLSSLSIKITPVFYFSNKIPKPSAMFSMNIASAWDLFSPTKPGQRGTNLVCHYHQKHCSPTSF